MKITMTRALGAGALLAIGLAAVHARAGKEPDGGADDAPAASASASAAPEPRVRDLFEKPPPGAESEHPKPDEWKDAEPVALARALPGCKARLLREWLRLQCPMWNPQAGVVITGSTDDVFFFLASGQQRMMANPGGEVGGYATVELPLRRGDRRLIQLTTSETMDYGGVGPQRLALLLSIRWLDDESGPTITALVDP